MDSYNPMALILFGQTEIRDILKKQVYEAIYQRNELRCHIPPLDMQQTGEFIKKHLEYAGETRNIFSDSAVDSIFEFSHGLPRKINRVTSTCLMNAAQFIWPFYSAKLRPNNAASDNNVTLIQW